MNLPFRVDDGKRTRTCTFSDLWVIIQFGLTFKIYSKRKFFRRKQIQNDYLHGMYTSINAIRMNKIYLSIPQTNYISIITEISLIKCEELHKWKQNSMVKLIMSFEIGD